MTSGKASCGMQYAVLRGGSAVGYCSLGIKCGTRDEDGFHSGIAHFTEHTLFKGTVSRSAHTINSYLDKLGGELNAYTTKEEIVLHSTVLKEDLGKALSLLLDLATRPTFPKEEINTEKGVVIDEINSYRDSPADEVYDKFEETLFAGHPLGRPILGTSSSVKKITDRELHSFVEYGFVPSNMAITVVADIDEKKMERMVTKLISKFFGDGRDKRVSRERFLLEPRPVQFDLTVEKRNHEANAVLGGMAPSLYSGRKRIVSVLLANILGGPASNSMLNSILREKNGWVYNTEALYTQYSDTGIFAICLGCDRNNLDKCFKAIDRILERLKEEPFSETRMKAARKQLLGQLAISSDNGETQCLSMGKSLLSFGHITPKEETKKEIESITAEEIQDLSREIFNPSNISRLIFL